MTAPTDYPALIRKLHAEHGDLDALADVLGWSKGTWSLIENGKRDPTRAQMNAIRGACGMELLPPEPVEIRLHDEPDAALLVNLDGKAPESVSVRTGGDVLSGSVNASVRVTARNTHAKAISRGSVVVDKVLRDAHRRRKISLGMTWNEYMQHLLEKGE